MEAVTLLTLWLYLPVGPLPDVHAEELARFPCYAVAQRETSIAWRRHEYVLLRWREAELYALPDLEQWKALGDQTYRAWDVWSDLAACYRWDTHLPDAPKAVRARLTNIRTTLRCADYYAGQLPSPVDVVGPWKAERVPLP
jgi:hypothetical protein